MDMVTNRCEVSLEDLIRYVSGSLDQDDKESAIQGHLNTTCLECVRKLMELKMVLKGGWPVIDIHLN
jgi:hypothetical protein